ncbi:restriction endonuclease subunit S [Chengkuizengella sediminis]|uniref:restriction endonuclease subunit S n=1 Tax=Chengkuizengella sediminis TaxID=1885917 RepID=UPI00138A287C|nr:restriction endonuclease subunit S [Chengkuizengella sediminis]
MRNKHTPEIRFVEFTEEWKHRKLGDLIKISSAARVHKNEWTTSGVRFFRSSDVVSNFYGKKNTLAFISYSLYNELSKKSGLVQPGDILVTGGGTIGIPYLVVDTEPLYFKDADLIWLKSANKIDGYFLYSYFVTTQLRKYISSITHIGTISHYTIEQAKDTPIILPEPVEQTLIGSFFKKIDDTIFLHQQELTTLIQTKLGFLQKMFPKEGESVPEVRFPGFTGEWEERKFFDNIKNIIDFRGRTPKKLGFEWSESGYLALSALNVKNGYIDPSADAHYGDEELYQKWMGGRELKQGQVLFTTEAPMGNVAQVPDNKGYILSQRTIAFDVDENKITNNFLRVLLCSPKVFNELSSLSSGGTAKGVSQKSLSQLKVQVPKSLEEQIKIGNFFEKMEETITLHQRELDALKETKKAFLQKLFA